MRGRRLLGWWGAAAAVVALGCLAMLAVARSSLSDRLDVACRVDGGRATLQVQASVHPPHRLRVDWGDGTVDAAAAHDYARPGRYAVRVEVVDARGHRLVEGCDVVAGTASAPAG